MPTASDATTTNIKPGDLIQPQPDDAPKDHDDNPTGEEDRGRMLVGEGAVADRLVDAREVLVDRATRTEVGMTDLGVAHLPLRQADILARREEEGVGAGVPQTVERRGARQVHGVVGRVLPPAPAVQDHQHHRTTFLHHLHLLASASGTPIRDSPSIHLMVPLPAAAVSATQ
jgi:hypothetical protein